MTSVLLTRSYVLYSNSDEAELGAGIFWGCVKISQQKKLGMQALPLLLQILLAVVAKECKKVAASHSLTCPNITEDKDKHKYKVNFSVHQFFCVLH